MDTYPQRHYEKFKQVVCDTDLFIHLISNDEIEILEMFSEMILIPEYVKRVEIRRKAGNSLGACLNILDRNDSFKVVFDKDLKPEERISKRNVKDQFDTCGLGETHCVALAVATIYPPIVVSNNDTEFYLFKDYAIPFAYYDILIILVAKGHMEYEVAEKKYEKLNSSRSWSSSKNFERRYDERVAEYKKCGFDKTIGVRF